MNCTEVCPKGISPTRAIKYIQRVALTHHHRAQQARAAAGGADAAAALGRAHAEYGLAIDAYGKYLQRYPDSANGDEFRFNRAEASGARRPPW